MSAIEDLLSNYQHVIDEFTVVTGSKGVFDVEVNGELLYSKHDSGRHAEPGEILELFEQHFAGEITRYGD